MKSNCYSLIYSSLVLIQSATNFYSWFGTLINQVNQFQNFPPYFMALGIKITMSMSISYFNNLGMFGHKLLTFYVNGIVCKLFGGGFGMVHITLLKKTDLLSWNYSEIFYTVNREKIINLQKQHFLRMSWPTSIPYLSHILIGVTFQGLKSGLCTSGMNWNFPPTLSIHQTLLKALFAYWKSSSWTEQRYVLFKAN